MMCHVEELDEPIAAWYLNMALEDEDIILLRRDTLYADFGFDYKVCP